MVETSELCRSCGSYSVPKRAKFCPSCGARVENNSSTADESDHVPMVSALPVAMVDTGSSSSSSVNNQVPLRVSAVSVPTSEENSSGERPASSFTSTYTENNNIQYPCPAEPTPESTENSFHNDDRTLSEIFSTECAMFWKNPSPIMLERAQDYQAMGGILFLRTSCRKAGKFTLPKTIHCGQILTGSRLDLSRADFVYPVTTIKVGTILGGFKLTVPQGVRVETHGLGILGSFEGLGSQTVNAGQVDNAPLLILQGVAILGGTKVTVNHDVPAVQVIS